MGNRGEKYGKKEPFKDLDFISQFDEILDDLE